MVKPIAFFIAFFILSLGWLTDTPGHKKRMGIILIIGWIIVYVGVVIDCFLRV